MSNTDNAARTGATVYLNGTRIDCSHKGRPSVTGAIRVESILNNHAALVEALEGLVKAEWMVSCDWAPRDQREAVMNAARAALALAKGGQQ